MNQELKEIKLRELVEVCAKTKNFKTLAVVYSTFIRNEINERSIYLGLPPIKDFQLSTQMKAINDFTKRNFDDLVIFHDPFIQNMRKYELMFIRAQGELGRSATMEIAKMYYELRKIKVPNLHQTMKTNAITNNSEFQQFSLFSPGAKKRQNSTSSIKDVLLSSIADKRKAIGAQLNKKYDKDLFQKVCELKGVEQSIQSENRGKIRVSDSLKDNLVYKSSMEGILGLFLLGIIILLFMLGIATSLEAIMHPHTTSALSILLLLFFGPAVLFLLIYRSYFILQGVD